MTLHGRHGLSNHRQRDCLFSSLFELTTKKTTKLKFDCRFREQSIGDRWIPLSKGYAESVLYSWHRAQIWKTLQWRHNGSDGVSNHRRPDCLLNRLFRHRWKLRVIGLCEGNSPATGEFPTQRASNAEIFPFDDAIMIFTMSHSTHTYVLVDDGKQ